MDRATLIQRLVLDKICDDYENVDQTILEEVTRDAPEFHLTITRSDVVAALEQLIALGLAKAYVAAGTPLRLVATAGMPSMDLVEEEDFRTWFYATPKGLDLQLNDTSWWPENETGADQSE